MQGCVFLSIEWISGWFTKNNATFTWQVVYLSRTSNFWHIYVNVTQNAFQKGMGRGGNKKKFLLETTEEEKRKTSKGVCFK